MNNRLRGLLSLLSVMPFNMDSEENERRDSQ
jgi:hypothetical protein